MTYLYECGCIVSLHDFAEVILWDVPCKLHGGE